MIRTKPRLITISLSFYLLFPSAEDFDESELMKELEDLEQEELNNELLEININEHKLPEVPASDIKEPIISNKDKKCKQVDQINNHKLNIIN